MQQTHRMAGLIIMSPVRQGIVTATKWLNNLVVSFKNWRIACSSILGVMLMKMTESHKISTNATKCMHKHGRIAYWSLATFSEPSRYNTWQLQTALDVTHQLTAQCKTALYPTWEGSRGWNNKTNEHNNPTSSEEVGGGDDNGVPSRYILRVFKIFQRSAIPPQPTPTATANHHIVSFESVNKKPRCWNPHWAKGYWRW